MQRREFISLAAANLLSAADSDTNLLLITGSTLRGANGGGEWPKLVASALKSGPWSVTTHRPKNPKPTCNDYYSEGPYWWPDPKNPNGPYIRRDGEVNPNHSTQNRRALGELSAAVLTLGVGATVLGDKRCGAHAAKLLSTWFLDDATRMTPHLEFGQAVPGHNDGRGTGIIDTVSFIHLVQGAMLLDHARAVDAKVMDGVRRWFGDYLRWLTTSKKGIDEMKANNNHATWWVAQVAAYATFARDKASLELAWQRYRTHLIPEQVKPDGSCPHEEARTRSLSYSAMNLDGYAVLCRIAELHGVDLWHFKTPEGIGIEKSFHYLAPYVANPTLWKKQQITAYHNTGTIFLALAGQGLKSKELQSTHAKLSRSATAWVQFVELAAHT